MDLQIPGAESRSFCTQTQSSDMELQLFPRSFHENLLLGHSPYETTVVIFALGRVGEKIPMHTFEKQSNINHAKIRRFQTKNLQLNHGQEIHTHTHTPFPNSLAYRLRCALPELLPRGVGDDSARGRGELKKGRRRKVKKKEKGKSEVHRVGMCYFLASCCQLLLFVICKGIFLCS